MKSLRVLIGISGGIAAYKIAFLIRYLKKEGAEVKCIMTPASCDFISPLVVSTLSENPVAIEFWNKSDGSWNNHVEYGLWADVMIIAPATANTLAKMVAGSCDNFLLATYLSNRGRTVVVPAMDLDMYVHPTTQRNLKQLKQDGVYILPAESGLLASGLEGQGRMAEPENILQFVKELMTTQDVLKGKKFLVTAGPTYEAIDPVRFIGNHSTGKMGFELAEELARKGAEVFLIAGPTLCRAKHSRIQTIDVVSAQEMLTEVMKIWPDMQGGIFAAAVADYKPAVIADQKIKKKDNEMQLELVKNPDILRWAGSTRKMEQILVGFALETNDAEQNGLKKCKDKNLDFIVVNSPVKNISGFGADTNQISIVEANNKITKFELKPKQSVAQDIIQYLIDFKNARI